MRAWRVHEYGAPADVLALEEVDAPEPADGELLVRVGPYRRALVLPDSLKRRAVAGARMVNGRLEVTFARNGTHTTYQEERS